MYTQEQMQAIFERPYVTIHHDPVHNIVIAQWKDFVMGHNAREALNAGLDYVIANDAKGWLSDTRKLGVLTDPDQQWIIKDWFPRALAGGLSRMATVTSERIVTQIGVSNVMRKSASEQLEQAYFNTLEEAHEWLIS